MTRAISGERMKTKQKEKATNSHGLPRLLIEEWLPAAAIGVECIRERSTGQQPPDKRLHVWWARRPLVVSRAAVLASLLPADFPRDVFERLLGFGRSGKDLVEIRRLMDEGIRVDGGFSCDRAFKARLRDHDFEKAHEAAQGIWGRQITVIDPMAGGGSIPLESARLGFRTLANEYNPVACSVLEATVDYPLRFGTQLAAKTRKWAKVWLKRIERRLANFYPEHRFASVHAYIFARTVPCPDTGFDTPLVPDWHLLKPKSGRRVVAVPTVNPEKGTWRVEIKEVGRGAGQVREAPPPSYDHGKGISLFTGRPIPADYMKAMAQQGRMHSALYAIVLKTPQGIKFQPPEQADLKALQQAEKELARLRSDWEKNNIIPTEKVPVGDKTGEPLSRGLVGWAHLFTSRQLLCTGVVVEELRNLRPEIIAAEGEELGEAVVHMLALAMDKLCDYNSALTTWHPNRAVIGHTFQRHDYAFTVTFSEMAPCNAGAGLAWAIDNVVGSYEKLANLARGEEASPVHITPPSWLIRPTTTTCSTPNWPTFFTSG